MEMAERENDGPCIGGPLEGHGRRHSGTGTVMILADIDTINGGLRHVRYERTKYMLDATREVCVWLYEGLKPSAKSTVALVERAFGEADHAVH